MFKVASWNLNSVPFRLTHVTTWQKAREPDLLLLQELQGTEFPSEVFESLGFESVAVPQKAYNGVAIISPCAAATDYPGESKSSGSTSIVCQAKRIGLETG
jgi:exonuclease III